MIKNVSISQARRALGSLMRDLEKKHVIELTRRGKPIAVLLSMSEYNRLKSNSSNFWQAHLAFPERVNLAELDIDPKIWEGVRDPSPGREIDFE